MKQIQPIQIWVNGESDSAEFLSLVGTYDNYQSKAIVCWSLLGASSDTLQTNYITIEGQDYINWGNQPADSINDWIYNWTAAQLNLTIVSA